MNKESKNFISKAYCQWLETIFKEDENKSSKRNKKGYMKKKTTTTNLMPLNNSRIHLTINENKLIYKTNKETYDSDTKIPSLSKDIEKNLYNTVKKDFSFIYEYPNENIQSGIYFFKWISLLPNLGGLYIPFTIIYDQTIKNTLLTIDMKFIPKTEFPLIDTIFYTSIDKLQNDKIKMLLSLTSNQFFKKLDKNSDENHTTIIAVKKLPLQYNTNVNCIKEKDIKNELDNVLNLYNSNNINSHNKSVIIIQKYIKSKGRHIWKIRSVWKINSNHIIWVFSQKAEGENILDISTSEMCNAVKISRSDAWKEPKQLTLSFIKTIENCLNIRFEEFIIDLLQDNDDKWWLLQVKAFKIIENSQLIWNKDIKESFKTSKDNQVKLTRVNSCPVQMKMTLGSRDKYCPHKASFNKDIELSYKMIKKDILIAEYIKENFNNYKEDKNHINAEIEDMLKSLNSRQRLCLYDTQKLCYDCYLEYNKWRKLFDFKPKKKIQIAGNNNSIEYDQPQIDTSKFSIDIIKEFHEEPEDLVAQISFGKESQSTFKLPPSPIKTELIDSKSEDNSNNIISSFLSKVNYASEISKVWETVVPPPVSRDYVQKNELRIDDMQTNWLNDFFPEHYCKVTQGEKIFTDETYKKEIIQEISQAILLVNKVKVSIDTNIVNNDTTARSILNTIFFCIQDSGIIKYTKIPQPCTNNNEIYIIIYPI